MKKSLRYGPICAFIALLTIAPLITQAQTLDESVCSLSGSVHNVGAEAKQFGIGLKQVPRAMLRPANLRWELPIAATTGLLIAKVDRPAADRIQSRDFINTASTWSDVGLGAEVGSSTLMWGLGCQQHRSHLAEAGFNTLSAIGAAGTVDLALKLAFDRQFPFTPNSTGQFWSELPLSDDLAVVVVCCCTKRRGRTLVELLSPRNSMPLGHIQGSGGGNQ